MKLTQAQYKALQAVSLGKVQLNMSISIRQRDTISGAREDVIKRLAEKGLIKIPCVNWQHPSEKCTMTDQGWACLGRTKQS